AERNGLAGAFELERVSKGDVLFDFGDPGDRMFIVHQGQVEISAQDLTGQKIVLEIAEPGMQFGELALFDGGARTAKAVAAEACELLTLSRDDIIEFIRRHPEAGLDMLAIMARRIRETNIRLRQLSARNASDEVDERLSRLQRVVDWIAAFSGSIPFLAIH